MGEDRESRERVVEEGGVMRGKEYGCVCVLGEGMGKDLDLDLDGMDSGGRRK
jgi:hypothetical protein